MRSDCVESLYRYVYASLHMASTCFSISYKLKLKSSSVDTPKKEAMALGLLGEKLSAERAKELSLVNKVVPKDQVMEAAAEMAAIFTDLTPTGIRLFKEMYADMGQRSYENRLKLGQSMMIALFKSKDGQEVLNSKDENRPPVWCEE